MRLAKLFGGAGLLITTALVGGTLIGSALAAPSTTGETGSEAGIAATGEYCETFLDAFAAELGVTREQVADAGVAASTATIEAAVAAGDLTRERADELIARISEAEGDGCALGRFGFGRGFAHGFGLGFAHGLVGADAIEAAASALGLESASLIDQMADGASLEGIAAQQGVSYDDIKAVVLADIEADLDAAVAEGMDQERADRILERLSDWLDDGGEPRGPGRGRGPWGH